MRCPFCGGRTRSYDGGEANDYQLCVEVCEDCGEWIDDDTDEYDEEESA